MEATIRLFVAATLTPELKEYLAQQLHTFEAPAVRILPLQNLHLTLYFIGNVPQDQLQDIKQKLQQVARQHEAFTLELETLEPGPKPNSPRLVWARFKQADEFEKLSSHLTQELSPDPATQRGGIPHVTLARFKKDRPAPKHLPVIMPEHTVQLPVSSIALWQSELASPHPIYTILETYPLG